MSEHSQIERTDATWNPVRGCTKVSPGCDHCYVESFAERFRGDMITLSNTFSYYCASIPMPEEDLKEYLQEPVAALPPSIAAALPKISILLVPYLERANGRDKSKAKAAAAAADVHAVASGRGVGGGLEWAARHSGASEKASVGLLIFRSRVTREFRGR